MIYMSFLINILKKPIHIANKYINHSAMKSESKYISFEIGILSVHIFILLSKKSEINSDCKFSSLNKFNPNGIDWYKVFLFPL